MATKNTKKAKEQKKERKGKGWQDLSGEITVYARSFGKGKKKFTSFSTSLATKLNDSDEKVRCFFKVGFKKDEAPEIESGESARLKIKSGFMTCDAYESKDGETITSPKIVILDFDEIEEDEEEYGDDDDDDHRRKGKFEEIPNDDTIPF